ncbi:polyphosphate polymerase domain-containing protein [Verrucomicrobiaceae bacterium 5K15]|uniref:Polyphosphate polymerase domain-containing protein n=1 Tax=Oceaniferula flava TaxID=2800421 RepID=A0AAE2SAU2_9BACT|nr:polyphosphate polymerase domain-containing protein [Oceaniferula flavus]MBK1854690.1 polyphosphate polymerase domain-containing protein [Oceaniferula flavus]MBM1135996.1 polyphosphate polymerase domain-containing protein [Oceaniferula flavus]
MIFPRVDRTESKFVIPLTTKDALVTEVEKHAAYDQEAGGVAQYPIISQYYDNAFRDCYWEKQRGQQSRRKLRIRVYGSDQSDIPPTTFIEVKHKCDGRGVKRRRRMPMQQALDLAEGRVDGREIKRENMSREERMLLAEVLSLVEQREFKFLCTLRYDRQAYVGADDAPDLRITFDTGIACRFEQLDLRADDQRFEHYLLDRDLCVMEVKTNTVVPSWLRDLVGDKHLVRQGFSKFCTAVERYDPVVRAAIYGPNTVPFLKQEDVGERDGVLPVAITTRTARTT